MHTVPLFRGLSGRGSLTIFAVMIAAMLSACGAPSDMTASAAGGSTPPSGGITPPPPPPPPGDTSAPTVSLSTPGGTVSGTLTLSASASDNVGVTGVQFLLDGQTLIGAEDASAPYAVAWDTAAVVNGTHTLTARARDAAGNLATSAAITVTVSNTAPPPPGDTTKPTVSFSAPAASATVSGSVTVSASAADNVGVTGVQFLVDGSRLLADDTSAPYSFSWNTAAESNGSHTLTAIARDAAGNLSLAATRTVTVSNDTTAPTVSISAPAGGASVSGTVTVSASASDNVGVAGVQFRLNGANLGAEDTTAPYSVSWNTTTAAAGTYTLTAVARDAAGNTRTSGAVSVTVSNSAPPPPPPPTGSAVGGYPMPSLQAERDTYTSWAWTWTTGKEPGAVSEPISNYTVTAASEDVQYGGEGDDLWTYLMMYRRTGNSVYLNRANAWLRYFKQDYVQDVQNDGGVGAHMYGWGLLSWYEHTCEQGSCDASVIPVAEQLGALVEGYWAGTSPGSRMANWGARRGGRHLLLASRLAQVTQKQRWIDLRDRLINLWLTASDWHSCGTNCGFYEIGPDDTNGYAGSGAYTAGYRIHSAFQIGILTEAFDHAYRTTANVALRDRLVAMANFVYQHGLDPTYQYTGSYFGLNPNGQTWHNYFASCGTSCSFGDSSYTTSLVNTLVRGYKFTGDRRYLDRAKVFFNRGTKTSYGKLTPEVGDNVVHHFVDTIWSADDWYLAYNKGELQYTYLIFENGGNPSVP